MAQLGAQVVLTSRDEKKGRSAVEQLKIAGLVVDFYPLDVSQAESSKKLGEYISKKYGRLDVLVNNAGILPDNQIPGHFTDRSILDTDLDSILDAFQTNTMGAIRVCQSLVPLMKKNNWGRIVNVSSQVAQLAVMDSGIPAYRISKVALNAVTRILSDELKESGILCNSVSPGWVKTEMGGPRASLSVEEGAKSILDLILLPDNGPTGQFFRNGQVVEW